MIYGAGDLKERVEVLELAAVEGGWAWESVRRTWAEAELTDRTNLFSKVGIGARDVRLVLRRQSLTLHNALRWKGRHQSVGTDTSKMSQQEIKEANTADKVFLEASIKILDAIEDINLNITI